MNALGFAQPQVSAVLVTDVSVASRISACCSRDCVRHCGKLTPVCCRNSRLLSCASGYGQKIAGAGASRGAGGDFAHSVTILLSVSACFVGPESVQSERVVFM